MSIKAIKLKIAGMTCNHCAQTIEEKLSLEGIVSRQISYSKNSGIVQFNGTQITPEQIVAAINATEQYRVIDFEELPPKAKRPQKHLIIIGGGSAAFAAALQAGELGAQITMINEGLPIGGTCVNVGCVPSKILLQAAHDLHQAQKLLFKGTEKSARLVDFKKLILQKKHMIQELQREKYMDVVKDLPNFTLIKGRAHMVSQNSVKVKNQIITGDSILVATGTSTFVPSISGLKTVPFLTNESLYDLAELPKHLLVLGANFIGVEAAQTFARFGSKVTLIEILPQILPDEASDVALELAKSLQEDGVNIITGARVQSIQKHGQRIQLVVEQNGKTFSIEGSHLLMATGRKANTGDLFPKDLKIERTKKGFLKVNEYLQTNIETIYGAGDVLGHNMFVYTAAKEGKIAAINALTGNSEIIKHEPLPYVVFTEPQIAGVGLDERSALIAGLAVESTKIALSQVPRFFLTQERLGFIKLIRDPSTDKLLGARIVAPEAGALIMEIAMGIRLGITVSQLREMLHPYLTASEGVKLAAISFSKNVKKLSCCAT